MPQNLSVNHEFPEERQRTGGWTDAFCVSFPRPSDHKKVRNRQCHGNPPNWPHPIFGPKSRAFGPIFSGFWLITSVLYIVEG